MEVVEQICTAVAINLSGSPNSRQSCMSVLIVDPGQLQLETGRCQSTHTALSNPKGMLQSHPG